MRASACGAQPAGPVDPLAEPDHPHLAVHVDQAALGARSAISNRIELVPQSMPATRLVTARSARTQQPPAHQSGSVGQRLVAERVHPGPVGQ